MDAELIPRRVRPGDTVAIVSPSAPAVARWPHRVRRGVEYLQSLGLDVRIMPNAAGSEGWVSGSPEARAEDIHNAFTDEQVGVVLCSIGGNHSNQLLPHLDYELMRSHPKVFQGYSDITVLHWALRKTAGLRTIYGPALTSNLAEYPRVLPYTDRWLRAAWFGHEALRYEPATEWTEEFLDWDSKADLQRARRLSSGDGWLALRDGHAEGPALGGCLETICWHLKGSEAWIDLAGAILFLETSEEAPSPAHVDAYLTDLELLGVFDQVSALVVARPYGYDDRDKETLWGVVARRTEAAGIPVLANVDLGHTDPMMSVPLGANARLDAGGRIFEVTEPATAH